jgi:branched-chain amino acid transport system permease protein
VEDTFIQFSTKDIFLFGVTIPLMVGLTLFVDRTRLGKAMRACAQDKEAAAMVGINVDRVIATTFFIGGALAGAAGTVWGLYINTGRFLMGFEAGLLAFTAAVLGGIGNIRGAVMGGFILGMVKALSDLYIGGEWTRIVIFGALILLLVFRPSGILGSTQSIEKV